MTKLNRLNERIGQYRWTICALLFFATTINYLDRQVLSLLKEPLSAEFGWDDVDYGHITSVFTFAYALSMLVAGRVIDWLGTRRGYAWSIVIWSIGAIAHALSKGKVGFMVARGILGFGESGNFPAAIKTTAEWFPKKERALATGIFNSGANIGAILAPITVPFIAVAWGWQAAFIIIGSLGFLWLAFWLWLYGTPSQKLEAKSLQPVEYDYIHQDETLDAETAQKDNAQQKISWLRLLTYRQTWSFAFGKFMTDGVWWFLLFWLPAFMKAQYGMSNTQVAVPLAVLYSMTCVGSICGGWFPEFFMKRGMNPYKARMTAMFVIALLPLVVLGAQWIGQYGYWLAVITIGIAASAHQAWSANLFTTVSDMFPKKAIGSVVGIGGLAGGLGGVLINTGAGYIFAHYLAKGDITIGYGIVFIICALAYLTAWCVMKLLVPKFKLITDL